MHLVSLNLSVKLIVWITNCIEPSTKYRAQIIQCMDGCTDGEAPSEKYSLSVRGKPRNSQSNEHWTVNIVKMFCILNAILVVKNGSYAICENSRKSQVRFEHENDDVWTEWAMNFDDDISLVYQWWDTFGLNTSMMKIAIYCFANVGKDSC